MISLTVVLLALGIRCVPARLPSNLHWLEGVVEAHHKTWGPAGEVEKSIKKRLEYYTSNVVRSTGVFLSPFKVMHTQLQALYNAGGAAQVDEFINSLDRTHQHLGTLRPPAPGAQGDAVDMYRAQRASLLQQVFKDAAHANFSMILNTSFTQKQLRAWADAGWCV